MCGHPWAAILRRYSIPVIVTDTYSELKVRPGVCNRVVQENFRVAVFSLETTVDKNVLLVHHKGFVMGNLSWAPALQGDGLPFNWVKRVPHESLDTVDVDSPHCCDRPFLEVTTTMDVQTATISAKNLLTIRLILSGK